MSINSVKQLKTVKKNVRKHVDAALEATGGLLRLAPAWVPRSFLQPGLRLKLHPDDTYAYGLNRGGIDERWFGSTTEAANEGRVPDEGLSYVVNGHNRSRCAMRWRSVARTSLAVAYGRSTASGRCTRSFLITWAPSRITCTKTPNRPSW